MKSENYHNRLVADWARQNIRRGLEVKPFFSSRVGMILIHLLLFSIPGAFLLVGIFSMILGKWDPSLMIGPLGIAFVIMIPAGGIALLGAYVRRGFVTSINSEGVKGKMGLKFAWDKLYYVDHVTRHTRAGGVTRRTADNQLELVFEGGKLIIPPLIHDRAIFWDLINTMPAEVRDDGVVRPAGGPRMPTQAAVQSAMEMLEGFVKKSEIPVPPGPAADHRRCSICAQLADDHSGTQKLSPDPSDTYLPPATSQLRPVREVVAEGGARKDIWQCPECSTYYLYRTEYEFLIGFGGSENTQELTRLTAAEAADWLTPTRPRQRANPNLDLLQPAQPPEQKIKKMRGITVDSVSVTATDPGFINVQYVQIDDGINMGGRLTLERRSSPLIISLLYSALNDGAFARTERKCGDDDFRVYVSGPDQQPIINILNQRPDNVQNAGLTGLMLTFAAAEALHEQLQVLG